ncbi:MAG: recombinase family protein [Acholeplasmataceae bacterium]|jgi:DNA invertase Pin-like site-specific DNA recombinase|nr:recombinase family protein [Acholeplasmataceae bacterium]
MKRKITSLGTLPKLAKKTRVAAYARVSDGKEAMLKSLSAQVSYYKKLISENHMWVFAGVYSDEALTGTKDSRKEFQQLLQDCRAGHIDMVITKSISRFARNTVTSLETVRELKAIHVDVFFEEQNIHSISGEGEMILSFLASFAQEESRSVSENMKWRIQKDFHEGLIWVGKSCLGYRLENKKLTMIPDEAEIVRLIFQLYIEGHGADTIGKMLDSKGIKPKYASKWNHSTIMQILSNNNYTGDLILQKTFRDNHLTKKKVINNGELNQYMVKDNHEAIISYEMFAEAERIRKQKSKLKRTPSVQKHYPFKGMVRCGICGRAYTRKTTPSKHVWKCSLSVTKGIESCASKQVPDSILVEATNHILNRTEFDEKLLNSKVDSIEVMPKRRLVFQMKDGLTKEYLWKTSRSDSWTNEMKEQARIRRINQMKGRVQHG